MKEVILCSAIWLKELHPRAVHRPKNTPGGVVLCGFRHSDIISQIVAMSGKSLYSFGDHVQGFLTNKNRFVDRLEGADIFKSNGGKLRHSTKLFSEDLY